MELLAINSIYTAPSVVIPAKAGIQGEGLRTRQPFWIPAFAGMTEIGKWFAGYFGAAVMRVGSKLADNTYTSPTIVIPAFAGMTKKKARMTGRRGH